MTSKSIPKYLQEESLSPETKDLISTLPTLTGMSTYHPYQYQGFWYAAKTIQRIVSFQKHFEAQHSDVFLVTTPKSGTTWLKAIIFALMNRKHHPIELESNSHPLLTHNPHDLVPFIDIDLYSQGQIPELASFPSPRLFSTHVPYVSLPESLKKNSNCKVVYLCRNPKDTFVSLWHFKNKLSIPEMGSKEIGEVFEHFCNGTNHYGPFWDHVLEYWKWSVEDPERVLFLKYEDMKEQPQIHLRCLAEFLNCPFSADEEEQGMVEGILKLCSFDHISSLQVNKNGTLPYSGLQNHIFFRRGEVGDWKNHLSPEMAERLDQITREKFDGTGLELL